MSWRQRLMARKSLESLQAEPENHGGHTLERVLGPIGLMSLGVGSIIGTGIFVLIGKVVHDQTGPSVMVSFLLAAVACGFAGLCYAEFASMVPVAGSAYTYAYATLGELMAWIIGWDLILEYAVSGAAVAVSWTGYFNEFLDFLTRGFGTPWKLPSAISNAPLAYDLQTGQYSLTGGYINLPAVLLTAFITALLVVGIKESTRFNTLMVLIKVGVLMLVVGVGIAYIDPANWVPFAPYGWGGVTLFGHTIVGQPAPLGKPVGMIAGSAIIFFSYIGFDSVSTQAEETKNPQRDLPIGIIGSLIVCTVLYVSVAAVLTGMVPYDKLHTEAPVSHAFQQRGVWWAEGLIAIGALTGITSVVLVSLLGQTRILMSMARDGLLPARFFGEVHPRYHTPWRATLVTGLFVALLSGLLPLDVLAEMVSIGTLFAFAIVCASVLIMRQTYPDAHRPFRVPGMPWTPILGMVICLLLMVSLPWENWVRLFGWLAIGLVIYFGYGHRHSLISRHPEAALTPSGIAHEVPLDQANGENSSFD